MNTNNLLTKYTHVALIAALLTGCGGSGGSGAGGTQAPPH